MTIQAAIFLFLSGCSLVFSITCYECTSTDGQDCKYTAKSCAYGFFGCVKIAIYAGGVDRMGNFEADQERRIVSMTRGCALIPFGHVDLCTQFSILGNRIQRCTCFNDFCNASSGFPLISLLFYLTLRLFLI